jgi:dCTP deaminase
MILKAEKIAELLRLGEKPDTRDPFVITPRPDLGELEKQGSASIDLRLGTWFVSLKNARMTHLKIGDSTPSEQLTTTRYVPFGREYILHPGNFVLSATLQWVRIPRNLAAYVIGKSSLGRRGLIIATATGVHPGFKGCLTLELSNVGEIPIAIKPGMLVCQLFFHWVDTNDSDYIDRSEFVGLRRPTLGRAALDGLARKLSESDSLPGLSIPHL